jgi:hypothetical protein
MAAKRARLLTFTIELNRDGNLEYDLDAVKPDELEQTLGRLGDIAYGHRVGDILRRNFRHLSEWIKEERS